MVDVSRPIWSSRRMVTAPFLRPFRWWWSGERHLRPHSAQMLILAAVQLDISTSLIVTFMKVQSFFIRWAVPGLPKVRNSIGYSFVRKDKTLYVGCVSETHIIYMLLCQCLFVVEKERESEREREGESTSSTLVISAPIQFHGHAHSLSQCISTFPIIRSLYWLCTGPIKFEFSRLVNVQLFLHKETCCNISITFMFFIIVCMNIYVAYLCHKKHIFLYKSVQLEDESVEKYM